MRTTKKLQLLGNFASRSPLGLHR